MDGSLETYARLQPPAPTPADELCGYPSGTPTKLMSMGCLSVNPLHCLSCNLEVPPERLGFGRELAEAIASWLRTYGAIDALELESGAYEAWARAELLDPASPPNVEGRRLARALDRFHRCYFWFWQPDSDDDFEPRSTCPVCDGPLEQYAEGIFPQLLCERDRLVLVGA